MAKYQLSSGALLQICQGAQHVENPVFQLLQSKEIPGTTTQRYRMLISDGTNSNSYGMLATQLNGFVHQKRLTAYSIFKVKKYQCNNMRGKKVIIILDLEVLQEGSEVGEKLGSPVLIEADGTVSTLSVPIDPLGPPEIEENVEYPGVLARLADQFSDSNINPQTPNINFTDVILCIDNNKVHCHKMILALTSKFFERMFASNMKEATSKEIPLKDIDLETLKSVLEFMYQDNVADEKITVQLLAAADMYEVMRLRSICIKKLAKTINLKNVTEIWTTAYLHNVENLAHCATVFMAKNWRALSKNEDIQDLCQNHTQLPFKISTLLADPQF